jgi:ribosome maturation factor RimP
MSLKDTIIKLVESLIEATDIYLVDVLVSDSKIRKKISIFIDTDTGISIDQCSEISHAVGKELEEIIENAFVLEVSSPGADSPLKLERQYLKNIGRTLKVQLLEGSEIKGTLTKLENATLEILPEKKKKNIPEPIFVKIDEIKEAKVILSFK